MPCIESMGLLVLRRRDEVVVSEVNLQVPAESQNDSVHCRHPGVLNHATCFVAVRLVFPVRKCVTGPGAG